MEFRRKLYPRGGSYETTIPRPLLFAIDPDEDHEVIFSYDAEKERWYIDFERVDEDAEED